MLSKSIVWSIPVLSIAVSAIVFFQKKEADKRFPRPVDTEINRRHKEGEERGGHQKYKELTRSLALGPGWREIGQRNMEDWAARMNGTTDRTSYAGGLLQGDFYERGASNITGSISVFDLFDDEWYALGSSGSLWKGDFGGDTWTLLTQKTLFQNRCLKVINNGGTKRIIATYKGDIRFSDDDGATWADIAIATYDNGRQLLQLPNGDLFFLATTGSKSGLHRSTDGGGSWAVIKSWNSAAGADLVSLWNNPQTDELYVLDGANKLYSVAGATVTLLNTGTGMPTGSDRFLTGYKSGATTKFYVTRGGTEFYKSGNNGSTWTLQSDISDENAWDFVTMANPANGHLFYGGVEFWKSTNEGTNWTHQNNWWDYYDDPHKFHADMMCFRPVRTAGGTDLLAVSCHGGLYVTYDNFATTTNISLNGLRYSDLYDVTTINGKIMAGAQDQGWHRFSGATGTDILTATQPISGDYVRMNQSQNGAKLWAQYPNGDFAYYSNPNSNSVTNWYTIGGTANTNFQQWAVPTCNNGNAASNSIYVGGGTFEGGGSTESRLIKLTGGNPVTATAFAYDFRANNGNTGWIAAVENSPVDPNYFFVASSTGKFFYSWDGGSSWTKHPTLSGPPAGWLFGSFIHASRLNRDKLWYCGAGGKIYQSLDGGANFTAITTGMPNTFVSELAMNAAETVLFAATDAGPYAYIFQTAQWYALADPTTPVVEFSSVEHIAASNLMRFSTQGRGIWDFQITAAPSGTLPIELANFDGRLDKNGDVQLFWDTKSEWNAAHFDIERSADGLVFEKTGQVTAQNRAAEYRFTDFLPRPGLNYYRLRQFDRDGSGELSPAIAIEIKDGKPVGISPNPASSGGDIFVENSKEGQTIRLFDLSGLVVFQQKIGDDGRAVLPEIAAAVYFFEIKNDAGQAIGTGKLLVHE